MIYYKYKRRSVVLDFRKDIAIENKEDRETYMSISPVKEFEEWLDVRNR